MQTAVYKVTIHYVVVCAISVVYVYFVISTWTEGYTEEDWGFKPPNWKPEIFLRFSVSQIVD